MVNTYPYVLLTKALLPIMSKSHKSMIVNMSSSASFFPEPFAAVYSATKVFNRYFSESMRHEKMKNVEILTVCPMFVQTNMTNNIAPSWTTGVTSSE